LEKVSISTNLKPEQITKITLAETQKDRSKTPGCSARCSAFVTQAPEGYWHQVLNQAGYPKRAFQNASAEPENPYM